jgi:hypothetical protein
MAIITICEATNHAGAEIDANIRNNVSKLLKCIEDSENPYLKEKSLCVDLIECGMPSYVRHAAARAESILGTFAAMYASASTGSHFKNGLQSLMDRQCIDEVMEITDFGGDQFTGGSSDGIGHTPQGNKRRSPRVVASIVFCDGKYTLGTSKTMDNYAGKIAKIELKRTQPKKSNGPYTGEHMEIERVIITMQGKYDFSTSPRKGKRRRSPGSTNDQVLTVLVQLLDHDLPPFFLPHSNVVENTARAPTQGDLDGIAQAFCPSQTTGINQEGTHHRTETRRIEYGHP